MELSHWQKKLLKSDFTKKKPKNAKSDFFSPNWYKVKNSASKRTEIMYVIKINKTAHCLPPTPPTHTLITDSQRTGHGRQIQTSQMSTQQALKPRKTRFLEVDICSLKYQQILGGRLKTDGKGAQQVRSVSKDRGVSVGKGKAGNSKNLAQLDQFYQTVVVQP